MNYISDYPVRLGIHKANIGSIVEYDVWVHKTIVPKKWVDKTNYQNDLYEIYLYVHNYGQLPVEFLTLHYNDVLDYGKSYIEYLSNLANTSGKNFFDVINILRDVLD